MFDNPNEATRKVLYKGLSNTESELSTQLRLPTAYKSIYVEANYRGTVIASGQYNTGGPIIPVELAIGSGKNSSIQSACTVTKSHGIGYTTTVNSVNFTGSKYQIEVLVEHDGCPGPTCKELSHYSIEADQGTYSNVAASVVSGTFSYGHIDL